MAPKSEVNWIDDAFADKTEPDEKLGSAIRSRQTTPAKGIRDLMLPDMEKQSRSVMNSPCSGKVGAELGVTEKHYPDGKPFLVRFSDQTDVILYPFLLHGA